MVKPLILDLGETPEERAHARGLRSTLRPAAGIGQVAGQQQPVLSPTRR